jgi:hypothetical protein
LLGSLGLFVWGLGAARDVYFDETWYVPTARGLIKSGAMMHQEHPPLGKLMIASGMRVFGDNPFGWRATSALFGSLTLVGVLIWSYALLRDLGQALWASAITLFDSIVYVQARIAMLDIFLMAFCAFALAFFTLSLKERKSPAKSLVYAMLMGVCLGLASACKLSGLFLLGGILAVRLLIGLLKLWRTRFEGVEETDFFAPDAWAALTPANTFLALVAATRSRGLDPRILRRAAAHDRDHDRQFGDAPLFEPVAAMADDDAPGMVSLPRREPARLGVERAGARPGDRRARQPVGLLLRRGGDPRRRVVLDRPPRSRRDDRHGRLLRAISAVGDQSEGAGILLLLLSLAALPGAGAGAVVLSRRLAAGKLAGARVSRAGGADVRLLPAGALRAVPRRPERLFRTHLVRFVAVKTSLAAAVRDRGDNGGFVALRPAAPPKAVFDP